MGFNPFEVVSAYPKYFKDNYKIKMLNEDSLD